jgi:DNA-directed RNA polymerase subunit H (RpoH/RPB5)
MHIFQSKHVRLNKKESEKILRELNISKVQLPKISLKDSALPEGCERGDIIQIERKDDGKIFPYFRVVV